MTGLRQPTAWRLMLIAFGLWAANFLIAYAAVLLAPGALATRLLAGALGIAGLVGLLLVWRRAAPLRERAMVGAALLIAALAILFNAATAFA